VIDTAGDEEGWAPLAALLQKQRRKMGWDEIKYIFFPTLLFWGTQPLFFICWLRGERNQDFGI
jgi:hypothetical protein